MLTEEQKKIISAGTKMVFSPKTINVFPATNSERGGQTVTEYNLRSQMNVLAPPDIEYISYPSYTYGLGDFCLGYIENDGEKAKIAINPGRGIINGHYFELVGTGVTVDGNEGNGAGNEWVPTQNAVSAVEVEIPTGTHTAYTVGLRAVYAGRTLAGVYYDEVGDGSIDANGVYEGIQVVILPTSLFKTPSDLPQLSQRDKVTAHLKLGTFKILNGQVLKSSIMQNTDKIYAFDHSRIRNLKEAFGKHYVEIAGMAEKKLYAATSKKGPEFVWKDITDHVLDLGTAKFVANSEEGKVSYQANLLGVSTPHGNSLDKYIAPFPEADLKNPGAVGKKIQSILKKFNEYEIIDSLYNKTSGRCIAYFSVLWADDGESELSDIDTYHPSSIVPSLYRKGDYILVSADFNCLGLKSEDVIQNNGRWENSKTKEPEIPPSTMYVIYGEPAIAKVTLESKPVYIKCKDKNGVVKWWSGENVWSKDINGNPSDPGVDRLSYTVVERSEKNDNLSTENWTEYIVELDVAGYAERPITKGDLVKAIDYAPLWVTQVKQWAALDETPSVPLETYYQIRTVLSEEPAYKDTKALSSAVLLTSPIPIATYDRVGGFYSTQDDGSSVSSILNYGLIGVNEDGRAYMIGADIFSPNGSGDVILKLDTNITIPFSIDDVEASIQQFLDEYVNRRTVISKEKDSEGNPLDFVVVTLDLSKAVEGDVITIDGLISRYNNYVVLKVLIGEEPKENVILYIKNCDRIKIEGLSSGSWDPQIILENVKLYYDVSVLEKLLVGQNGNVSGLSFWYKKISQSELDTAMELDITVDGLTVTDNSVSTNGSRFHFDPDSEADDTSYELFTRSITFNEFGQIIKAGLNIRSKSSASPSMVMNQVVALPVILPRSSTGGLDYPNNCLLSPIRITGQFMQAYQSSGFIFSQSSFSFVTQYNALDTSLRIVTVAGSFAAHFELFTDEYNNSNVVVDVEDSNTESAVLNAWSSSEGSNSGWHYFEGSVGGS